MNLITILIWITIAIIAAISIIAVKLHYKGNELEHEEGSILPGTEKINDALTIGKNTDQNSSRSLSPGSTQKEKTPSLFRRNLNMKSEDDTYIVPDVENNDLKNYEYESQNQVLVNYDNNVKKFQEPIKQNQMDIMTQNNKDTSELKDLFTIDELIKESKRKDVERQKESQTIKREEDDAELDKIKQSIKNKTPEPLIEEVITEEKKSDTISDLIKEESKSDENNVSVASQKDIDKAIDTASKESGEAESISDENDITNTLLKQEEISEPTLKTPSKVGENNDYKLGTSIDDTDIFKKDEEDVMDLDYRKDLDKVKNKIKGSKLFQEVRDKLTPEEEEIPPMEEPGNEFIRTVNEYDEYEPIINETHLDFDGDYEEYHDEKIRQENTRRVFNMAKNTPEPEMAKPLGEIKNKPARANIKIKINNTESVLKKGDEIIFNHNGETYSSQVYAINGDDISVKYRRENIKIKPGDVKKIY